MKNYNFEDILNQIKSEETTLYFVQKETYEDDCQDPQLIGDIDIIFAGTSQGECYDTINELEQKETFGKYEFVRLWAGYLQVSESDLEEKETAEDAIMDYLTQKALDGFASYICADWAEKTIREDYESLTDSIILYWKWETHVGYARKAIKVEYCDDAEATTLWCKPEDSTTATQTTVLVSRSEIEEMANASELVEAIEDSLGKIDKMNYHFDADEFVRNLYRNAEMYPHSYHLPQFNDLKED